MANETEKFVLQYVTEISDSLKRLEQLQTKVKQTGETSDKAGKQLKEFGSGAADEIGKLIPGINGVTAAVRTMGGAFAIAGVAIAAVAVGVKSVLTLRDQYNSQRDTAAKLGVGQLQVEEYTRQIVKNGGQRIDRAKATAGIEHAAAMFQSAYLDPQRMSAENRALRLMGVDVGQLGKPKPFNEMFTQLAKNAAAMNPQEAQGKLQALGFDKDVAEAIRKAGEGIGVVSEQTLKEVEANQKAQESLAKFNAELGKFDEAIIRLQVSLGQKLLPAVTAVTTWIADKLDWLSKDNGDARQVQFGSAASSFMNPNFQNYKQVKAIEEGKRQKELKEPIDLLTKEYKASQAQAQKKVDEENKNAQKTLEAQNEMRLAVNMFNGAVTTFANAVDMQQAIAAWAGQIGRDVGLGTKPGESYIERGVEKPAGGGNGGSKGGKFDFSKYEPEIMEASEKLGVPVDLIKKVIAAESSVNPNAVSKAGAQGLMQVMPANFKALGITNGFDPRQNIMGGTQLLAEALKMSKGDVETALRIYQGGPNRRIWGKENAAYPEHVLSQDIGGPVASSRSSNTHRGDREVTGEGRGSLLLRQVEQNVADRLGVPLAQLKSGGVTKGDAAFALSQMEAGVQNNITKIKTELNNIMLNPVAKGKLQADLIEQQQGLANLQSMGAMVVDQAKPGAREITINELVIHVNNPVDAETGKQAGIEAGKAFSAETNAIVNQYSSSVKL